MKNFISFLLLVSFAFFLTGVPVNAAAGGTLTGTVTTSQTLSSGTLTVTSTATLQVSGSSPAVNVTGTSTIDNLGLVNQTGTGRAIRDSTGNLSLSVTNGSASNSSATLQSVGNDTFQMSATTLASSVFLDNYGKIIANGSGNRAINWNAIGGSNTLNNYYSGLIQSSAGDAVRLGTNGVLQNSGKIYSFEVSGSTGSDGIDGQNNSGIQITNAASATNGSGALNLIEGGRHGITGAQLTGTSIYTMTVTNNAGGTIQGDNGSGINIDGFNGLQTVTVNNSGTITGNGSVLTGVNTSQDGDGVDIDGVVNITNSGLIKSINAINETSEGVTVGGGTITNSGTIEGSVATSGGTNTAVGRGITLAGLDKDPVSGNSIAIQKIYANTVVTNSGLIKGDTDSGIAILGITGTTNFSVTITNTLGGVIEGGGSVGVIDGSALANGEGTASSNNETVINYGTIQADGSGNAISLGMGLSNTVQIMGGSASVIGNMSGGMTGTNTAVLTIDPTTGHSFSYSGVISNFSSVQIKSGTVILSGSNTYTGATAVTGGKLAVDGSITGSVTVNSGAELGGHGTIGGTIGGAGAVGPGNSPGILTAASTDPTGGLSYNFEFTQAGVATWSNASASGNDVLHLTAVLPFTAPLTSSNTVNLYFSSLNLTFDGGFFVDGASDTLTANIANATFNYYVLDNTNGTVTYNGNKYDQVTGTGTTVSINGANFASGTVSGFTEQFSVQSVPEPSTWLLLGIGALGLFFANRRRNRIE